MTEEARWEEAMLEDLARAMPYPPAPELRAVVLARMAEPRAARPAVGRLALAAITVLLAVSTLTVVVSRDARDAVAGFLGLAVEGERIAVFPTPQPGTTATPFPTPLATTAQLEQIADRVTREQAIARIGVEPILPASLGEPIAYYIARGGPDILIADYGTIQIWEFAYEGEYFIGKGIQGGGSVVQALQVNGEPAYWVSGGERLVTFNNALGTPLAGTQRTVTANALLWAADGVYRRIEGAATLDAALQLAAEMR